jgi:hypothetical protein
MHTQVETIIDELYTVDPSLREHEASIRALVTTLINSKPEVIVSETFIRKLREGVVSEATRAVLREEKPVPGLSWWMLRLAPIGVLAVLTLLLLPEPAPSPTPLPYREQGGTEVQSDTLFKTSVTAPAVAPTAGLQNPVSLSSVTVERASFVVIHADVDGTLGEIVGVSKLLFPGTTVGVRINLLRGIHESESFVGVLYADNGDGLFGENDTAVINPLTGAPLYIPLN